MGAAAGFKAATRTPFALVAWLAARGSWLGGSRNRPGV